MKLPWLGGLVAAKMYWMLVGTPWMFIKWLPLGWLNAIVVYVAVVVGIKKKEKEKETADGILVRGWGGLQK